MPDGEQVDWKALRRLAFKALAGFAGLSFLFGGGLIKAIWGMDRLWAEMIGIAIAFVFGALAALVRASEADGGQ